MRTISRNNCSDIVVKQGQELSYRTGFSGLWGLSPLSSVQIFREMDQKMRLYLPNGEVGPSALRFVYVLDQKGISGPLKVLNAGDERSPSWFRGLISARQPRDGFSGEAWGCDRRACPCIMPSRVHLHQNFRNRTNKQSNSTNHRSEFRYQYRAGDIVVCLTHTHNIALASGSDESACTTSDCI